MRTCLGRAISNPKTTDSNIITGTEHDIRRFSSTQQLEHAAEIGDDFIQALAALGLQENDKEEKRSLSQPQPRASSQEVAPVCFRPNESVLRGRQGPPLQVSSDDEQTRLHSINGSPVRLLSGIFPLLLHLEWLTNQPLRSNG